MLYTGVWSIAYNGDFASLGFWVYLLYLIVLALKATVVVACHGRMRAIVLSAAKGGSCVAAQVNEDARTAAQADRQAVPLASVWPRPDRSRHHHPQQQSIEEAATLASADENSASGVTQQLQQGLYRSTI